MRHDAGFPAQSDSEPHRCWHTHARPCPDRGASTRAPPRLPPTPRPRPGVRTLRRRQRGARQKAETPPPPATWRGSRGSSTQTHGLARNGHQLLLLPRAHPLLPRQRRSRPTASPERSGCHSNPAARLGLSPPHLQAALATREPGPSLRGPQQPRGTLAAVPPHRGPAAPALGGPAATPRPRPPRPKKKLSGRRVAAEGTAAAPHPRAALPSAARGGHPTAGPPGRPRGLGPSPGGKERGSRPVPVPVPHLPAQPTAAARPGGRRAAAGQRPGAWSPPEGRARTGGERADRGAYHGGGRGRRGAR